MFCHAAEASRFWSIFQCRGLTVGVIVWDALAGQMLVLFALNSEMVVHMYIVVHMYMYMYT